MNIGELEKKLLRKYPAKTAFKGDKTGLLVGDRNVKLNKVLICLDPDVNAVKIAKNNGCNLVLTHHPAFFDGVNELGPANSVMHNDGAVVYEAIKSGVALMNFHTALDVSADGTAAIPNLLDLKPEKVLSPINSISQSKAKLGYGKICSPKVKDKNLTLEKLAKRCYKVFGRSPRVWGVKSKKLNKIVTFTGSSGRYVKGASTLSDVIRQKPDCFICGEIKYSNALALRDAGIAVIDLGHDVSELPLVNVLEKSVRAAGVSKNHIVVLDQSHNWFQIN